MVFNFRQWLYRNHYAKSVVNSLYVYGVFLFHMVTNWMPGILRTAFFRLLLRRSAKLVFFDHNIYIKFPWLVVIGTSVVLNRGVEIYSDFFNNSMVRIGSGVRLTLNVQIHASEHEIESGEFLHQGAGVKIGDNDRVRAGSIIYLGIYISENSVVVTRNVVTKNPPLHSLVTGVPAVAKKTMPYYGEGAI